MGFSITSLKAMFDARYPTTGPIGHAMFLRNPTSKISVTLATTDVNAATLTVNNNPSIPTPGVNEPNRAFALGTRFVFTAIGGLTSDPQVVVNRIYHVIDVTGDDISISETPLDVVGNAITFTAGAGTPTLQELNFSETITTNVGANTLQELSEAYTVEDLARYEIFLGASVDRPAWTPNAFAYDRPRTPSANTMTSIMPRAKVGEVIAGLEEAYDGFALTAGTNATVFDTAAGTIEYVQPISPQETLQLSVTTTILAEIFGIPSNAS